MNDLLSSGEFGKFVALSRGPLGSPGGEVGVHHDDHLLQPAFVRQLPSAIALVQGHTNVILEAAIWLVAAQPAMKLGNRLSDGMT
jgi:hypothetical protein